MSCLEKGGEIYFMKGPGVDPEIEKASKEYSEYYRLKHDIAYELPKTEHKRRLVVFEKIKLAPLPEEEDNDILLHESFED